MLNDTPIEPLPTDPQRQAHSTIAAFAYQLWCSVDAWLNLKDNELLFLEGAEDFDVISREGATTTQIKSTCRSLTLRSADIVEAITNFWKLKSRVGEKPLKFGFIFCGSPGSEAGNPFGKKVSGLKLWTNAANGGTEVRQIARFLAAQSIFPIDFRNYLKQSGDKELQRDFFQPIVWLWEQPGVNFVETGVSQKLALLGQKYGVLYSEAAAVRYDLYTHVTRAASNRDAEPLTRAKLLELFEQATHRSISNLQYNALNVLNQNVLEQLAANAGNPLKHGFVMAKPEPTSPPPLPNAILERRQLISQLNDCLKQSYFLIAHGSTGMGKTTAAKLLARDQCAIWISCGVKDSVELRSILNSELQNIVNGTMVIFDDISFNAQIEQLLAWQILELQRRKCLSIVTTTQRPSRRFLESINAAESCCRNIPSFSAEEIVDLLKIFQFPDQPLLERYAEMCLLKTSGHPQLLQALLSELRAKNWPDLKSIFSDSIAIADEKEDARQLLQTLDEGARDLIYRLSVVFGTFRRDHAIAVADLVPSINRPGEHLDRVIGPWLEPLQNGYFRLSPLIAGVGSAIYTSGTINAFRVKSIDAVIDCEPRTSVEASFVLTTAFAARSTKHLIGLLVSFGSSSSEVRRALAESMFWFLWVKPEPKSILYPEDLGVSRFLRYLQFQIAAVVLPSRLSTVAACWHEEVYQPGSTASAADRLMLTAYVLSNFDVDLSAGQLFIYLKDFREAEKALPDIATFELLDLPDRLSNQRDLTSVLAVLSIVRCKDIKYFETLVELIEASETGFRALIINAWKRSGYAARYLIDEPWLAEDKKEQPDWNRCLQVFRRAFDLGRKWDWLEFSIHSIRGLAVILDEKLARSDEALSNIDELAELAGLESFLLDDARATIHFNRGQDARALDLWTSALSNWPHPTIEGEISKALAARIAGRAAGRLGRFREAAELFELARKSFDQRDRPALYVGLGADAAISWWDDHQPKKCGALLIEVLRQAENLPSGTTNLLAFRTRKIIGHAIMWLSFQAQGKKNDYLHKLAPGVCSEDYTPKELKSLPDVDTRVLRLFLARLASSIGLSTEFYDPDLSVDCESILPALPLFREEFKIQLALREGNIFDLPVRAWAFAQSMETTWTLDQKSPCPWPNDGQTPDAFRLSDVAAGSGLLVAGLIAAAGRGEDIENTLDGWQNLELARPSPETYQLFISQARQILGGELKASISALYNSTGSWWELILHGLRVTVDIEASSLELVHAHCNLLIRMCRTPWLEPIGQFLCNLIEVAWKRQIQVPASLNVPRLTIPAIVSACEEQTPFGVRKSARILLSALPAVSVQMSQVNVAHLREIESGDFSSKI